MSNVVCVLRKPKVLNMSIFDWVGSIAVAALIGYFILRLRTLPMWTMWLVFWVFLGVAVHWALGINTMLGYYLGINPSPIREDC